VTHVVSVAVMSVGLADELAGAPAARSPLECLHADDGVSHGHYVRARDRCERRLFAQTLPGLLVKRSRP
jgi:hypothetical protein